MGRAPAWGATVNPHCARAGPDRRGRARCWLRARPRPNGASRPPSPPRPLKPRVPARRPRPRPRRRRSAPRRPCPSVQPADIRRRRIGTETEESARPGSRRFRAPPTATPARRPEPQGPQDGIIVVGEPTAAPDGIPDMRRDPRTPEDIAAFDVAAGRLQPLPLPDRARSADRPAHGRAVLPRALYRPRHPHRQLRDLSRGRDRRHRHQQHLPQQRAAWPTARWRCAANVRAVSDWRTHAVELRASGLASFYQEFPTEDDRAYALRRAAGSTSPSAPTSRRSSRTSSTRTGARTRDSPTDAAERGDIETNRAAVALNHRFNRLSLQLRGAVTDVEFAPVTSTGGGIISNAERNFTQRDAAVRDELGGQPAGRTCSPRRPSTTASSTRRRPTASCAPRTASATASASRSGRWDATMRGEVSAGWGRQAPRRRPARRDRGLHRRRQPGLARLGAHHLPADGALGLRRHDDDGLGRRAVAAGGSRSAPHLPALPHRHRRHQVRRQRPTRASTIKERTLTSEAGFDYYLGRDVIIFARYQHIDFQTTAAGSDYTADIVRIGMRVRQ